MFTITLERRLMLINIFCFLVMLFAFLNGLEKLSSCNVPVPSYNNIFDFLFDIKN